MNILLIKSGWFGFDCNWYSHYPNPQALSSFKSQYSSFQIIKFARCFLVISILYTVSIRLVPFQIMLLPGIADCNIVPRLWAILQSMAIRTTIEAARIILICPAVRETRYLSCWYMRKIQLQYQKMRANIKTEALVCLTVNIIRQLKALKFDQR